MPKPSDNKQVMQIEDKIHVDRIEVSLRPQQAFPGLCAGAQQSAHRFQDIIVEALHPDGQTLDTGLFQQPDIFVREFRWGGLRRDFFNVELLLQVIDEAQKLVHEDSGRAAADVKAGEAVAPLDIEVKLFFQVAEIGPGSVFLEQVAVEAAEGAQRPAEGNVDIEGNFILNPFPGLRDNIAVHLCAEPEELFTFLAGDKTQYIRCNHLKNSLRNSRGFRHTCLAGDI